MLKKKIQILKVRAVKIFICKQKQLNIDIIIRNKLKDVVVLEIEKDISPLQKSVYQEDKIIINILDSIKGFQNI